MNGGFDLNSQLCVQRSCVIKWPRITLTFIPLGFKFPFNFCSVELRHHLAQKLQRLVQRESLGVSHRRGGAEKDRWLGGEQISAGRQAIVTSAFCSIHVSEPEYSKRVCGGGCNSCSIRQGAT